jgi:preprotein translocase subunit SecE
VSAGLFERVARFVREVRAEMKKVVWPDRRATAVFTAVVVLVTGIVALVIWATDLLLTKGFSLLFHTA